MAGVVKTVRLQSTLVAPLADVSTNVENTEYYQWSRQWAQVSAQNTCCR